jgi:hypothetical protein
MHAVSCREGRVPTRDTHCIPVSAWRVLQGYARSIALGSLWPSGTSTTRCVPVFPTAHAHAWPLPASYSPLVNTAYLTGRVVCVYTWKTRGAGHCAQLLLERTHSHLRTTPPRLHHLQLSRQSDRTGVYHTARQTVAIANGQAAFPY